VYAYHQYCYEVRERKRQREREAESERFKRECRAQRQRRWHPVLAVMDLLNGRTRRAAGLELDP